MQEFYSVFEEELKKLNSEQRKAVIEYLEGPVMVIAGPGTGKTQILTARIGVLLSSQLQVKPHEILCLTYTEAGAIAMKERLLRFIGPEAHRVNITTFHSFCNQIIQEHPEIFGNKVQQVLSELEQIQLFEELIDSFEEGNPLKRYKGDTYFEIKRLKSMFEAMRKESWSVAQIEKACSEFFHQQKNSDVFISKRGNSIGQPNEQKINDLLDRLKKTAYAARQLEKYEALKIREGRYDFTDMIYWVIEELKSNAALLADYQERFQYILVDEYQDTSGAQNDLLFLLCNYWDNPNLFVVGDEDQSIYRFQGANIYNILHFQDKFSEYLKTVVLKENYRSTQYILDGAAASIKYNRERLTGKFPDLDKNLRAANKNLQTVNSKPQVLTFMNSTQEELFIINELLDLHAKGEDLSEVAVIYGKHRHAENIIRILQKKGIPLNIKRKLDILKIPLIKNIITLLSYLWREYKHPDSAEELLYEILHFQFLKLETQDIHTLLRCITTPPEKVTDDTLLDFENPEAENKTIIKPYTWRQLMADHARLDALNLKNPEAVKKLEFNLSYWQKEIPNLTLQALFEKILTRGGLLEQVMLSEEKTWEMQIISTFFDFIKEETAKDPDMTLGDVLNQLRMLRKYELTLPIQQYIQAEKGINFVTAHSSKGLEYKRVYILRCNAKEWEEAREMSQSYLIPPTLLKQHLPEDLQKLEDQRRLFYVAVTRAKEKLFITLPQYNNKEKPLTESLFVSELLASGNAERKIMQLPEEEIIQYRLDLMTDEQLPVIALAEESFMRERLKNFAMTVTHLNKYLKCPISFYFENILKVPAARTESSGFGNAVHKALQELFSEMNRNQKTFPPQAYFLDAFRKAMHYYQSHFTKKDFELRMEYGKQVLGDYYQHYVSKWNTNVSLEFEIRNIEIDGIPVKGKLDKIEYLGEDTVAVVDYKTGKVTKSKIREHIEAPSEKKPLGGDYWRQIVFYRLLLDHQKRKRMRMLYGEINFVEKDKDQIFHSEMIEVKEEHIHTVRTQLKDSYTRIMNLEFSKGCGDAYCTWCNFVKNNYRAEDIRFEKEEEEVITEFPEDFDLSMEF
jgi:DNA helicase-2/ATP-dependent DNA helicase PcrA